MRHRQAATPRALVILAVTAALVLATGCGSRQSHETLLAAVQGSGGGPATAAGAPTAAGGVTSPSGSSGATAGAAATVPGAVAGTGPVSGGGDGTGTGTTPGGETSGATAASCTGREAPLNIASVGTFGGIVGSVTEDLPRGGQAWVAMINAKGGLACHKVNLQVVDDGGDPARMLSEVRRLVEQDGVVAFINMGGVLTGQSAVDYLTQKNIPVIGSDGATAGMYTSPAYFPQQPSLDRIFQANIAAIVQAAKGRGLSKFGLFTCIEVSFCATVARIGPGVVQANGMTPVAATQGSLVQPDFTSQCQKFKDAGAELVFAVLDAGGLTRMASSCASIGYRPTYAEASILAGNALTQNPLFDHLIAGMTVKPFMVTSDPGIAEYQQALATYLPGVQPSAVSITGWVSAKILEAAGQHLSDPPTSQDILSGLWTFQSNDIGGLTSPLTFTQGQPAVDTPWCYWVMGIEGGQYVSPDNGTRTCQS